MRNLPALTAALSISTVPVVAEAAPSVVGSINTGVRSGLAQLNIESDDFELGGIGDGHIDCTRDGETSEVECGVGAGIGPRVQTASRWLREAELKLGLHSDCEGDGCEHALGVDSLWETAYATAIATVNVSEGQVESSRAGLNWGRFYAAHIYHGAEDWDPARHGFDLRVRVMDQAIPKTGIPTQTFFTFPTFFNPDGTPVFAVGLGVILGPGHY